MELRVGELTFHTLAEGPEDGPLVLLLHGFPQSGAMWRPVLGPLAAAGYRSVAPDQRGYSPGARPAAQDAYAMANLVEDVLGIADGLGAETFHLVGHDWGGAVAWHVAARHPARLRTLSVVSTPHPVAFQQAMRSGSDQAKRSSYMLFFRREGVAEERLLRDDGEALRRMMLDYGLPPGAEEPYLRLLQEPGALTGGLNWYRTMSGRDLAGLQPVTTPTLYVWGEQDAALGREAAERTAEQVAGPYRFVALPGIGHWVVETAGDELINVLLDHLASAGVH